MRYQRLRRAAVTAGAAALTVVLAVPAPSAFAAPGDAAAGAAAAPLPATVSADALPTVQINGVAWAQLVVGNTVYVAGQFTSARPAGSPAGSNETARGSLLAYDIRTGNLISSWAPTLNGTGYALAASADGKRIYIGGSFTTVNGVTRNRIAAVDATTGALVTSFKPSLDARVRAIARVGNTLYFGGRFSNVNGSARTRLAAVDATSGALLPWAASADNEVLAMTAPTDPAQLVIAGRFALVNDEQRLGTASLDLTTGANRPWAVQETVYDYGNDSAVYSLSTDGTGVYATGYNYGNYGNFENSFAAEADGGKLRWLNPCLGDTYSSYPLNGALYLAGHTHDCSAAGGLPDLSPRQYQWAMAETTAGSGKTNPRNAYGWAEGTPGTNILPWTPTLASGTFTGQNQAAWSVAGNSQYVVYGGEFPSANGRAQQGLVRFAVRDIAPNQEGPRTYTELAPSATTTYPGQVRISWRSAWDRDDALLTYELLRGSSNTVVASMTASTSWWDRPPLALTDPSPLAGAQSYRVRVTDSTGNVVTGPAISVTARTADASAYPTLVQKDGATDYWRLGDSGGLVGGSSIGEHDLTVDPAETRGADGATNDGDTSMTFTGVTETPYTTRFGPAYRALVPAATTFTLDGPQTYSTEAWIKTTTTTGGKIIGFGDSKRDYSGNYDRQVYMTDDGRLVAGVYDGSTRVATSTKSYNDGEWHHVVATLGTGGLQLYVDGARVAVNRGATTAQPFNGYWRIGGDNLNGWPSQPTSRGFAGSIDDVAVYPAALTLAQVQGHYSASGRTPVAPTAPSDPYGQAVYASEPRAFWRLQDASGPTLADASSDGLSPAVLNGSTQLGAAGVPGITGSTAATFTGNADGGVASATEQSAPGAFSTELWFNTTSTRGGKLIGFGSSQSGYSGSYDRHVIMNTDGTLHFGVWTGQENRVDSTKAYNDGTWHHLVATQGSAGMAMYVDGVLVGTNAQTQAQSYSGYWRVGGDNSWGPTDNGFFDGTIDDVAIYGNALTATDAVGHFRAGGGNTAPTAAFTPTADGQALSVDASASADADGTIASYAWTFGDGGTGTGVTASHSYATPGTYTVTLTTTDDKGATTSSSQTVAVRATGSTAPADAYGKAVYDAGPDAYYRLDDAAGATSAADSSGMGDTGVIRGGVRTGAAGATGTAASFDGNPGSVVIDPRRLNGPTTYSLELWFNTTSTRGGKLVGFGDGDGSWYSGNYDRHVIMNTDGTLHFGVWTGYENRVDTSTAYNDGKWHHLVATQGPAGMVMYVDGASVGTNGQTQAQGYTGSWRVGGDSSWGPTQNGFFDGSIDEVAFYSKVLGASTVADHHAKGVPNQAPVADFAATPKDLTAAFDASASKDADGTVASYAWDFGDGTTGTGATASHAYTAAGTYQVKLTVTDDKGLTGTTTKAVTVTAPVNQAPVADFAATPKDLTAAFDASASKDADGTVASYAWDFGDGTTGTGRTASHTYTAAGSHTVTLTVTDDKGATGTVSKDVVVTAPVNQAPTASFTSTAKDLALSVDASLSADSDGTVASYAWDFGDRTTGTGRTASHTYTAAGTYQVKLTVTDDKGAPGSVTREVVVTAPVAANKPPTASFTSASTGLAASFDGSGSTDSDGTVASYAWDFGDQTTGTGRTASHTYAAAGTYQVVLTVTDDKGATASSTRSVVVTTTTPPATTAVAADAFGRTTTGGWGTADTGGAWTTTGGAASGYSVSGGAGRMTLTKAGTTTSAFLTGVSSSSTDLVTTLSMDKPATGGGTYLSVIGRRVGADDYRAKIRVSADGSATLALTRVVGGTETSLRSVSLGTLRVGAGDRITVRLQALGTGSTTLNAKVWAAGGAEPTAWAVTATDTTASLQAAGGVGVSAYVSGSSTNVPVVVSTTQLTATKP